MSLRVGFFPQNNSLWVLRHRGILERAIPDVEWVNLRELPAGPKVDPTKSLPSQHGDHLFERFPRHADVLPRWKTAPLCQHQLLRLRC